MTSVDAIQTTSPSNAKKREREHLQDEENDNSDEVMTNASDTEENVKVDSSKSNTSEAKEKEQDEYVFSPELLSMYYNRLFPFDLLYSWLSYDPSAPSLRSLVKPEPGTTKTPSVFTKREFSFTIEKVPGEEIYIRYKSFPNKQEMESTICKMKPHKIDIGAVYTHPPKDKDAFSTFKPTQRELVFDIDLTDYDSIRNCGCQNANICRKCWTLMTMAMKVMQRGLKEDFGFQHIVWFYSGRRGVHCWVCDPNARQLTNDARTAVATYFEVMAETDHNKDSMNLTLPLHPLFQKSFDILEPWFIDTILPKSGHGLLASPTQWEKLLSTLPEGAQPIADKLSQKWLSKSNTSTPADKWQALQTAISAFLKVHKNKSTHTSNKQIKKLSFAEIQKLETWKYKTVFTHTYPRLDINVSKMQNHLLKSPFCVHPKTGRVCIPINLEDVESFDPFEVPTLPRLMRELDAYAKQQQENQNEGDGAKKTVADWQKTSLNASFEYFRQGFLIPMQNELRREEREAKEEQAAYNGDF